MERDPEKARAWQRRGKPMKQGGRLRARSPRQTARYAAIAKASETAINRDGIRCVARGLVPEVRCAGKLDPHHLIPKGVDRRLAAEPRNIVGVCRAHHDWIDVNNGLARELGLHGHYGDDLTDMWARREAGRRMR